MTEPAAGGAAEADYRAAGFGGELKLGRSMALLVVDPAVAYVDPECPLYAGVETAVERIRELVASARWAGVPVIVTRVSHGQSMRDGGIFARKVPALKYLADSRFGAYIEGLEPQDRDIEVVKQYPSAFAGTSLAATLTALGVDTLVITGFSTSGCIRATATDAMQSGFIPVVVADAVGDRLPGPHEANLFDIQAKIGEVVSSAEALDLFE